MTPEQRLNDALSLDQQARQLAKDISNWFVSTGLVCVEVEDRELWAELTDDQGKRYKSFGDWIMGVFGEESKSSAYDARNSIRATKDNVPEAELRAMKRTNIKTLAQLSPAIQKREDVRKAALTKSKKDFVGMIENDFPSQHVESETPFFLKPTKAQRWEWELAIENVRKIEMTPEATKEECMTLALKFFNERMIEVLESQEQARKAELMGSPILERIQ